MHLSIRSKKCAHLSDSFSAILSKQVNSLHYTDNFPLRWNGRELHIVWILLPESGRVLHTGIWQSLLRFSPYTKKYKILTKKRQPCRQNLARKVMLETWERFRNRKTRVLAFLLFSPCTPVHTRQGLPCGNEALNSLIGYLLQHARQSGQEVWPKGADPISAFCPGKTASVAT